MRPETSHTQNELLQLIATGDQSAYAELFHQYKHRVFVTMLRLTGSVEQAEDIVQEVFMSVWDHREQLPAIANINAYLFSVAQHKAIDSFRKVMRQEKLIVELMHDTQQLSDTVEQKLSLKEAEQVLAAAVDKLPQQQKAVYYLSREHGLKHEEIARRLNISPGTVKNHMIRALRMLRTQLAEYRGDTAAIGLFLSIVSAFEK